MSFDSASAGGTAAAATSTGAGSLRSCFFSDGGATAPSSSSPSSLGTSVFLVRFFEAEGGPAAGRPPQSSSLSSSGESTCVGTTPSQQCSHEDAIDATPARSRSFTTPSH
jgi:hypothetical protein